MNSRYDVFQGTQSNPLWLESADGLNRAIFQMEQRARANPGCYFVFDSSRQIVVASLDTNTSNDSDLPGRISIVEQQ